VVSRVAAVADVYLLNRQPKFYGPKVNLHPERAIH